jgi:hypothetical protein
LSYLLIPSEYKKLLKTELFFYKLDLSQLMIGSSIILPILGKIKKLSLISILLDLNIKPKLMLNISFQNISDSILETMSMLMLEIQLFVFLEKNKIVSSLIIMISWTTELHLMLKLVWSLLKVKTHKLLLKSQIIKLLMLLNMVLVYGSTSTIEFQKDLISMLLEIVS